MYYLLSNNPKTWIELPDGTKVTDKLKDELIKKYKLDKPKIDLKSLSSEDDDQYSTKAKKVNYRGGIEPAQFIPEFRNIR